MSKIYASNSRLKTSLGKLTTSGLFYFKMSRPIKFRVWNESEKKYFIPFIGARIDLGLTYFETHIKCAHPEQFTGLKDKNIKDVYEGDILREIPLSEWDEINYACFEVFFHDGDAASNYDIGFTMDRMHCHGSVAGGSVFPFKPKTVSKMIVIGNIHENPELLNP